MTATTMHAEVLTGCGGPRVECERKRVKRSVGQRRRTRLTLTVVALAAIVASAYGERWVLRDAPLPALEYVVATCAARAVQDEQASSACASNEPGSEREDHE